MGGWPVRFEIGAATDWLTVNFTRAVQTPRLYLIISYAFFLVLQVLLNFGNLFPFQLFGGGGFHNLPGRQIFKFLLKLEITLKTGIIKLAVLDRFPHGAAGFG